MGSPGHEPRTSEPMAAIDRTGELRSTHHRHVTFDRCDRGGSTGWIYSPERRKKPRVTVTPAKTGQYRGSPHRIQLSARGSRVVAVATLDGTSALPRARSIPGPRNASSVAGTPVRSYGVATSLGQTPPASVMTDTVTVVSSFSSSGP